VDGVGASVVVVCLVEVSLETGSEVDDRKVGNSSKSSDVAVVSTSGISVDLDTGASVVSAPPAPKAAEIESQSSIDPEQTGIPSDAVQSGAAVGQI